MPGDHSRWATYLPIVVLLGAAGGVVWWVSTPEQRAMYLGLVGMHEPAVDTAGNAAGAAPVAEAEPASPIPTRPARNVRHGQPGATCRLPPRDDGGPDRDPVFQWQDANGHTTFSDRPPDGRPAKNVAAATQSMQQFARVTITAAGSRYERELRAVIGKDVTQLSLFFRGILEVPVADLDIGITMHGAGQTLAAGSAPGAAAVPVAGIYDHGNHQIAIADQDDFAATRRVARHELSHALLGGIYGPTPIWLNEGLAEVAETLEVDGQSRSVSAKPLHVALLREQFQRPQPGALAALLSLNDATWRREPAAERYARAWALVHELMSHDAGRLMIRTVLAAQLGHPCTPLDSVALVDEFYPGGVTALEERWQQRMRDGAWPSLAF